MMVDPQSLSYPQFSRRFDLGVRIVLSLIALATLCSLWFFIPKRLGDLSFSSEKKGVVSDLSCDHCVVDSPAVSILPEHERKYLPNLSREIALVNVSSRPDSNVPQMMLYFTKSKLGTLLSTSERVYFNYNGKGLQLSSVPTPFYAIFEPTYDGIDLEATLCFPEGKEISRFHLVPSNARDVKNQASKVDSPPESALESMKNMQCFGPDKLYETYGGETYQPIGYQNRLLFAADDEHIFVDEMSFLIWNGTRWKTKELGDETRGWPLASVKSNGQGKMEVEIWGRQGIFHQNLSINMAKPSGSMVRMEQMISRVRLRTASRISCKLGKKNTVIKTGDWLFHHEGHWKVLRALDEVDKCLSMKLNGDLFVFDGIVKEKDESFITGHLFDPMRTVVERVAFPVNRTDKVLEYAKRSTNRRFPMDDYDDDDDFDDEDDDFNDDNEDYLQIMNSRGRHESYDRY